MLKSGIPDMIPEKNALLAIDPLNHISNFIILMKFSIFKWILLQN